MKKLIGLSFLFCSLMITQAQVGINNNSPRASLDIQGKPNDVNITDGVIAPQIKLTQLNAKHANNPPAYTSAQKGTIIHVTDIDTSTIDKTINIKQEGHYYFDGNIWQSLVVNSEPWIETGTTNKEATAASSHIYRNTNIGLGDFSSSSSITPDAKLHIKTEGTFESPIKGFKLADGNQQDGRFLTTDKDGLATWTDFKIQREVGVMTTTPNPIITIGEDGPTDLGSYIELSNGKWEVEAGILLVTDDESFAASNNSYSWVKLSFDDPTINGLIPIPYNDNTQFISGSIYTIKHEDQGRQIRSFYSLISGKMIIENKTDTRQKYKLIYISSENNGPTRTIRNLGGNWAENYIYAVRIE